MSTFQQSEIHDVPTIGDVEATVQYTVLAGSTQKAVLTVVRTDGRAMTSEESAFAAQFVHSAPNRPRP